MRDVGVMGMREAAQHTAQDIHGAGERDRAVVTDPGAQGGAGNEGTGVVDEGSGAARAAGPHEIGVAQPLPDQQDGALELQIVDAERQRGR